MDCSAIVLNKLLAERNLDLWAKLKLVFLDPAFSSLYSAISRYYDTYSAIPSFSELELTLREGPALRSLATIKLADNEEVAAEVALDALIDQYTQNEALKLLDKFLDKLPVYDTAEVKEQLSSIVLTLDEKTLTTENVYDMSSIMLFQTDAALARDRIPLAFNNTFDAMLAGVARQELILVGGQRGSGKSIVCSNILVNQYEMGNTSVYFTIEMIARETLERNMSIAANVDHQRLKKGTLTDEELLSLVRTRAAMFEGSEGLVKEFITTRDKFKFESQLVRDCKLKKDNQMIIVDDRALTLTSLDLHLGKIKSRFGDKFTVAVVDYLNQIVTEGGTSQFDWQPQIVISKKLKELARKYDIVIFSPYQIDAAGEARFAKGILDAADIALLMKAYEKEKGAIGFGTTKIRGASELSFVSPIDWSSLRISPQEMELPSEESSEEKPVKRAGRKKKEAVEPAQESATDLPWNT